MKSEPSASTSYDDLREDLIRERETNSGLVADLRSLERSHAIALGEVKAQLKAELQKSASLEKSIQNFPFTAGQVVELQSLLKQAELKSMAAQDEFKHRVAEIELKHKEDLASVCSKKLEEFKEFALAQITEKEKVIIEDRMIIERSDALITDMSQEIEYLKSLLLSERQKHRTETELCKARAAELEQELKNSLVHAEKNKNNREEGKTEETQDLKVRVEDLLEELKMKSEELKIAEKKILQLKQSRLELAETINSLEFKIETLTLQKEEISKGLQNKDETIHLLEEEISSSAENLLASYQATVDESEKKIKRLEKIIREMEQKHEDQLEESLGTIASSQLQINELTKKIILLEKEKELGLQKFLVSQKKISELENKICEFEQEQSNEIDKFKSAFKEKILQLTHERDELELRIKELQEQAGMSRPSIIEPGGSLFDELAQLPEGRFSRLSLRPTVNEDNKRMEGLITSLAEKDTALKNLISDKASLEETLKKTMTECKDLQTRLTLAVKNSEDLKLQLEMTKWELETLRTDEDARVEKGKILVLESEKELIKAEKSRLETELMLSKENWAELNNNICKELLEAQAATAMVKLENLKLKDENEQLKLIRDNALQRGKKKSLGSWFKRD